MKSKNTEILADKRKHSVQTLTMLSKHCAIHRMLNLDLNSIAPETLEKIGTEVIDLFVDRVSHYKKKTPPKTGATISDGKPSVRWRDQRQ
ncbi:hypothetical protein [Tateyamaria sp.]|uniref:hypothetical protein n=1 Tax=Tateyamaria sp. TaxID=1929288 RepID=UPI00329AC47F